MRDSPPNDSDLTYHLSSSTVAAVDSESKYISNKGIFNSVAIDLGSNSCQPYLDDII